MSYDLTAQSDEQYSEKISRQKAHSFISTLPHISSENLQHLILLQEPLVYMEIDLALVNEDGDCIENEMGCSSEVNCINFHIPYGYIEGRDTCITVARQIADIPGWTLRDWQEECFNSPSATTISKPKQNPWWKFW